MFHLNVGDKAPVINAKDENGNNFQLSAHKGKKVILYFYPKDNTPGCTAQACNLKDNYTELQKRGYEVVGVSADDEVKHQKFIAKYDLPFTLLADTDKKVIQDNQGHRIRTCFVLLKYLFFFNNSRYRETLNLLTILNFSYYLSGNM